MANQLQVVTRLIELRMLDGQSIDGYYKQYLGICSRLTALKCEVSKQVKTAVLLRGLPESYDTVRAAYLAKGTAIEISELMESLRSEEIRMKAQPTGMEESMKAMKLSRSHSYVGHGVKLKTQGPDKHDSPGKTKFTPKVPGPPGSCYDCGRMGHKARDCHNKLHRGDRKGHTVKAAQNSKTGDSAKGTDNAKSSQAARMMSLVHGKDSEGLEEDCKHAKVTENTQMLFIDSGASSHMMHDRSLFAMYQDLKNPVPVKLGDGRTVHAIGIGTVNVSTVFEGQRCMFSLQNVFHVPDLSNNLCQR